MRIAVHSKLIFTAVVNSNDTHHKALGHFQLGRFGLACEYWWMRLAQSSLHVLAGYAEQTQQTWSAIRPSAACACQLEASRPAR